MILSFLLTFYVILILWYIFGIFGLCIMNSKHGIPAAFLNKTGNISRKNGKAGGEER